MSSSSAVLVAFLTSTLTAAGTVYVIERYNILPSRTPVVSDVVVPDLRGITEADARANASAAHIALLVASREPSPDAKPGSVLRQSIAAGQRVPREHPVSIVLAEEILRVPNVTGLAVAEATERLRQRGYDLKVGGTTPDEKIAQGLILDQAPKAETPQAKGAAVTVQVSGGRGDIEVPKLVGVSINQAKTDLEKLGVKMVVRWVALAETPCYVVLSQKPAPGEKVKPGSEVQLTACR
jgi:beta-lactam-binding protein with PASTA domain